MELTNENLEFICKALETYKQECLNENAELYKLKFISNDVRKKTSNELMSMIRQANVIQSYLYDIINSSSSEANNEFDDEIISDGDVPF